MTDKVCGGIDCLEVSVCHKWELSVAIYPRLRSEPNLPDTKGGKMLGLLCFHGRYRETEDYTLADALSDLGRIPDDRSA